MLLLLGGVQVPATIQLSSTSKPGETTSDRNTTDACGWAASSITGIMPPFAFRERQRLFLFISTSPKKGNVCYGSMPRYHLSCLYICNHEAHLQVCISVLSALHIYDMVCSVTSLYIFFLLLQHSKLRIESMLLHAVTENQSVKSNFVYNLVRKDKQPPITSFQLKTPVRSPSTAALVGYVFVDCLLIF